MYGSVSKYIATYRNILDSQEQHAQNRPLLMISNLLMRYFFVEVLCVVTPLEPIAQH